MPGRVPEPACEQEAHECHVERADRLDQPPVDPEDERHRPTAHPGRHVRGAHAESLGEDERRVFQGVPEDEAAPEARAMLGGDAAGLAAGPGAR